jgi:predicted metalloprotease with PDZ domain
MFGVLFCLAGAALAQAHHRTENRALLGIVTAPDEGFVRVLHVLDKSPAAKAGIEAGDEIQSIGGKEVGTPADVDAALAGYAGKEKVEIEYRRDKKAAKASAKLIERKKYKGKFLERRQRGATKFEAPEWFVYAWHQGGEAPPTLENAKKKVIVIHCFQSW